MNKLTVDQFQVKLSNLDKVLWPEQGYTKGDMINYYIEIYPYIKKYLKNRPLALKSYPDGITKESFFQKNIPDYAPHWLSTYPIYSKHRKEPINWVMINKLSDLIWVANRASIELHGWFSSIEHLDKPDFAVFDLDPGEKTGFQEAIQVAQVIRKILLEIKLNSYIKTSGKAGLHVFVPLKPVYSYKQVKLFLKSVADMVIKINPELATIEWRKEQRQGKVHIDYRQNGRAKTLPAPYSLRPTKKATISTPLSWDELGQYTNPENFNLSNIKDRLNSKGDLWSDMLNNRQELPGFLF